MTTFLSLLPCGCLVWVGSVNTVHPDDYLPVSELPCGCLVWNGSVNTVHPDDYLPVSAALYCLQNPQLRGSIMFTYVQSDEYCEKEELSKTVTTDETEQEYPLYVKLMGSIKTRQQILNYRTMYVMVDLTDDVNQQSYVEERALVAIKAHPDGAFDMLPGFSKPGYKYRFEDSHGGIYEYTVENASLVEEPTLEKRTSKLQKAVEKRAEEVRRNTLKLDFQPPPINVECFRMLLLMEIMGLADFEQDQLYVDYMIKFDPEYWDLQTAWKQFEPGVLRGVTQISRLIKYPEDTAEELPGRWVAHLAHPVELELLSRGDIPESKYPAMMMQVCSYDRFNRHTYEGYGWLSLPGAGRASPASAVHYVHTWRPQSTQRDKLQEFFIGGSKEVDDWSYMLQPFGSATPQSKVLNKYGFKTETTGVIKVRLHTLFQQFNPDIEPGSEKNSSSPGRRQITFKSAAAAVMLAAGGGAGSPGRRNRRDHMSLEAVVARARSRLKDARGGDVVVRPGLLSEVPMIRMDPTPVTIPEGGQVQFKIVASGMEPLRYQWYKDDRRLTAATSDSPTLIIPDVAAIDQGQYHCQVSNKDGAVNSVKAALKVERAGRLPRESQLRMSSIRQQQSPAPGAAAAAAAGSSSSFSPSGMLKSRNRQARLTALLRQEDGTVKETVTNQQSLSEVVAATSTRAGVTTMTQELITVEADGGVGADNPLAAAAAGSSSSSRAPVVMAGGTVAAGGSSEGPSMNSRTAAAEQQQQMAGHHATLSAAVVGPPPPGLGPSSSSEMNTDVEYYRTNEGSSASLAAMSAVVSGSGFRELPSSSSEGPHSHQPPSAAAATSSAVGGGVGSGPTTTTTVDAINAAESTTESSSDVGGGGMMSAQEAIVQQSFNNKQRTRMATTSSSGGATKEQ
ncbi:hypothetical protein CEUSTIGMA_g12346.t1 [Chlamydomonas eustigma]|uniref:Ig-like domain-containing protein n=1 Tax=Chlamydomonas eustigma TaxID=1157962 RepID=A0A250XPB9_9CHLO|nr:hypothetical protein CEUSTIGMA_g12346.t1 [Chlamydomonas eustigma]|eukprot:GAX84925.1 hypothetical protein CEUSTIGMA_g12346.t1 [Chlamydomonas eustigma]